MSEYTSPSQRENEILEKSIHSLRALIERGTVPNSYTFKNISRPPASQQGSGGSISELFVNFVPYTRISESICTPKHHMTWREQLVGNCIPSAEILYSILQTAQFFQREKTAGEFLTRFRRLLENSFMPAHSRILTRTRLRHEPDLGYVLVDHQRGLEEGKVDDSAIQKLEIPVITETNLTTQNTTTKVDRLLEAILGAEQGTTVGRFMQEEKKVHSRELFQHEIRVAVQKNQNHKTRNMQTHNFCNSQN